MRSGSSYISQEDKRLHFGLGPAKQADLVEVRWPDGTVTQLPNVKADQVAEDRAALSGAAHSTVKATLRKAVASALRSTTTTRSS